MKRNRRYWLRLLGLFVVTLLLALVLLPTGVGWLMMSSLTHSGCGRHGDHSAYDLPYEDITFPAGSLTLGGFFLPGTNGATVIVVPALSNDRGGDLPDAAILNRAGFNVLTFDSRVCRGSAVHSLGYAEAEDAEAAYAYLQTRSDIDSNRVSIHGFSSGGSTSLFTAARLPALRGVSAKGGYHDFAENLGLDRFDGPLMGLFRLGAEWSYRAQTGLDVRVLSPLAVIEQISPRPIFLIYGSREVSLPGARAMLERARQSGGSAELWVVEGAGHGNYLSIAGADYERRLVEFHESVFLDDS